MNNPILMMAMGAILIAFSPILTKAVNLPATPIGFYRFFFATITIAIVILLNPKKMKEGLDLMAFKKSLPFLVLAGFFFSIDLWFWNRSILSVGSGVATLLANTQVFYLAIIGLVVFKERLKFFFYPAMLISVIGIWLTSLPYLDIQNMPDKTMGIVYGLLTGVSYTLVTFSLRKSNDYFRGNPILIIFFMTFFAMIFSFSISMVEGSFKIIEINDIGYMFLYGSVVHFLGWLFISKSIKIIPIALASLLLLLQPAFATILGYFIYDEYLNVLQILGLFLSLIGIYLAMRARE